MFNDSWVGSEVCSTTLVKGSNRNQKRVLNLIPNENLLSSIKNCSKNVCTCALKEQEHIFEEPLMWNEKLFESAMLAAFVTFIM